MFFEFRPYVPVAQKRANARRQLEKLKKKGQPASPVEIQGRTIAKTFWGKAWCDNLESYSDFATRLPRGRTYVRNGSVVDLQISKGSIEAYVAGSELYKVTVTVDRVSEERWNAICKDAAGAVSSLVELLQGRFSKGVMERLCDKQEGLFPSPKELKFACSCPDWASICKHVAAVLYGVGARTDETPELFFKLRDVDEKELISHVTENVALGQQAAEGAHVVQGEDLAALFGIEMADTSPAVKPPLKKKAKRAPPKKSPKKRKAVKKRARKLH